MTSQITYRELSDQLDQVLAELQQPDLDIDRALALYKEGQQLIIKLEEHLKTMENSIIKLTNRSSEKEMT